MGPRAESVRLGLTRCPSTMRLALSIRPPRCCGPTWLARTGARRRSTGGTGSVAGGAAKPSTVGHSVNMAGFCTGVGAVRTISARSRPARSDETPTDPQSSGPDLPRLPPLEPLSQDQLRGGVGFPTWLVRPSQITRSGCDQRVTFIARHAARGGLSWRESVAPLGRGVVAVRRGRGFS